MSEDPFPVTISFAEERADTLAYHVPTKDEKISSFAKRFYKVKANDKKALAEVRQAILKKNPGLVDIARAGVLIALPILQGIPPIIPCVVRPPTLSKIPPPPDTEKPISAPLGPDVSIGTAEHIDHTKPGCVYFWEFFQKVGPLQSVEYIQNSEVWVEFEGRTSMGVGPASVNLMSKYVLYEADNVLERVWQWQEIWGVFKVICAEPGDQPAKSTGRHLIDEGWVLIDQLTRRVNRRELDTVWTMGNPTGLMNDATSLANTGKSVVRGTDVLP